MIKSPDGVVYKFKNLNLWCRNHADILPGTPENAEAGIREIKKTMQGKRKLPVMQWKGWILIDYED